MKRFDNHLLFHLPKDYVLSEEVNDENETYYAIKTDRSINDDGEEVFRLNLGVHHLDGTESILNEMEDSFSLKSNMDNKISFSTKEMNVVIFNLTVCLLKILITHHDQMYLLLCNRVLRDIDDESELQHWLDFVNQVLSFIEIDETKAEFEQLTKERLFEEKIDLDELEESLSEFPIGKPLEGQHTHVDFLNRAKASMSLFGGLVQVNQSGTEYSFLFLSEMNQYSDDDDETESNDIFAEIVKADTGSFELSDRAFEMAEVFRVVPEFFDPNHDREQEIKNQMIHRATMFDALRSFSWTLNAYCDENEINPEDVEYEVLEEMAAFIEQRNFLNYTGNSYSPVLCSGDDIHVYFIPDAVNLHIKDQICDLADEGVDDKPLYSPIASLDGLRKELEYMYPAIKTIYDELESTRDDQEPLKDGTADLLYAWCSLTYAAKEPFYTEDGPMNCFWEHPDEQDNWKIKFKLEQLKYQVENKKEWLKNHTSEITKNPVISFKDKLFVFTGVSGSSQWEEAQQKLIAKGGIQRTAVSGKTDYLVCEPFEAGESQLKKVKEQKRKGHVVQVILYDDFLKALGMTPKTVEEEMNQLNAQLHAKKKEKKKS